MTAAVTTETGARGRLSELVLAIVVLADLVLLVLFSLAMQFARVRLRTRRRRRRSPSSCGFAWEIGGAVAFGVLVGALFALYLRYVGREVTLVLHRRVRAAQPGRHDAAVRAAAGGGGRRARHREPGDRAGRRAEDGGSARRARRCS